MNWRRQRRLAERARRTPTSAERLAAPILLSQGYKFQECLLQRYRVDFVNQKLKVIIEIDGASHYGREVYDRDREWALKIAGYSILRFTNRDIIGLALRGELRGDPRLWSSLGAQSAATGTATENV